MNFEFKSSRFDKYKPGTLIQWESHCWILFDTQSDVELAINDKGYCSPTYVKTEYDAWLAIGVYNELYNENYGYTTKNEPLLILERGTLYISFGIGGIFLQVLANKRIGWILLESWQSTKIIQNVDKQSLQIL